MDQHLEVSITLSFALVVFFAIVFYQPDQLPSPSSVAGSVEVVRAGPVDDSIPPLTPVEPPPENQGDRRPSRPEHQDASSERSTSERFATTDRGGPEPSAPGLIDGPGPETVKAPKHDGFTIAIEGETLKDVALRVYGPSGDDEMLWRLNRDLIDAREAVLTAGTPLRTP
jgi:hypothetical protein